MLVTKRNGKSEPVQFDKITDRISKLIQPNETKYINPTLIAQKTVASIYPGISTKELDLEAANICINLCTTHHYYSNLAGRILASNLKKETLNNFVDKEKHIQKELKFLDSDWIAWINNPDNKKIINAMIDYERDYNYDYFGFKTLERAYLLKIKDNIIERPQDMFMRVASFINKGDLEMTKKTYDLTSLGYYTHATPTLFNAGNIKSQCSSCFEGNTKVNTFRGSVAIKDIQIGDEVITHLGNVKKVVQIHKNLLGNRKLYNLIIHKTKTIIVTQDHNLYIYNKILNTVLWKQVKDLDRDDYIMIPNYKGSYENKNDISNEFAKLIGLWLMNGSVIMTDVIGITIYIKGNDHILNWLLDSSKELYIDDIYFDKEKKNIILISDKLGNFFNDHFYRNNTKSLPDFFYKLDTSLIISFLSGIVKSKNKLDNNYINIEMTNGDITEEIYCLCRLHNLTIHKNYHNVLNLTNIFNKIEDTNNDIIIFENNTFLRFENKLINTNDISTVYTLGIEDDHSYSIEGIIAQNCFLMGTDDSMKGITKTWQDVSEISKWGGGIGLHISNIRSTGSLIRGTNGPSSGIIPMLRVYNEIARYVDQCFVGNTLVYTENNRLPIEEIKTGDKVFGQDGNLYNVDKVYSDVYEGVFIKLYFKDNFIKVTKNHPFLRVNHKIIPEILDDYNMPIGSEWCEACDLSIGDEIYFSIPNQVIDNKDIDESDCYMYVIFLTSGYIFEHFFLLIISNKKLDEFITNYLEWNGIDYTIENKNGEITYKWEVTSKFRFSKSQFREFDNKLLHLPFNKYKWFIKGIFEICGKKVDNEYFIRGNKNIKNTLSFFLLKIGIIFKNDYIYLNSILENILKNNKFEFKQLDFIVIKIDKIEQENDKQIVYDLEVNTSHTYLTELGIVHNGGKRKGSIAIYLEPHHPDIMAFLELRKNSGVESERTRDLNLAMWISDLFMKQVECDGDWHTMDPDECKGLNEVYGEEYEAKYNAYVKENKFRKVIKARTIMEAMLDSQIETGQPYITYKDHVNRKSNQKNIGVIKSSNLCVHEDTLILTDQGYKNIKSLKDKDISVWNGEQWSKVMVKQTGINKNLIRINLSNGAFLDCTPEHRFYIQEKFNNKAPITEVDAAKLQIGSKLIKFNLPKTIEFDNSEEFKYAYTHGAFCGDNYSKTKEYAKLYLYGEKKKLLDYIEYESYTINDSNDRYDIVLPKDINPKFDVPMRASIHDRLRWLEGYSDTDGTIAYNGTNESLQIASINKEFLLNVRLMLHTLGIESKVTKCCDEKEYLYKPVYRLLIESCDLYNLSILGFSPKRLQFNQRKPQRNTKFVKVVSIEDSYQNVDTYCFTEPIKNMGVFNGILTGQCNEIVEYSSHEEYAVCNLASIAINKCVVPFICSEDWIIYVKQDCKYCKWAKAYLNNNFKNITEKEITFEELFELTQRKTFPQIYYGDTLIGGFDDMYKFTAGKFDYEKLYDVAYTAAINLDKVIDVNFYPVIEAKRSNMRHRPIGLGIQGLADALSLLKIPFDSEECLEFNARFMETIYLAALTASKDVSKSRWMGMKKLKKSGLSFPEYYDKNFNNENEEIKKLYHILKPCNFEFKNKITSWYGAYSTFEGSPISQGIFQFDMWNVKPTFTEKWEELRNEIKIHGVRNSLVTALMPTATTSQILGNNECFEPFTSNIYTRRTLAGDFPLVNKYLIDDLDKLNLWSLEMKELILANNGSIANFNNIPDQIKRLYQTSWEIKQIWILKNSISRGAYVDQTQSLNIYMSTPNYKNLISSHVYAWKNGLKTGIYYLRSKPAAGASKFTLDPSINNKLKMITQVEEDVCLNCSA
jgi:ribonucleotide reductase alpha subunit